MTAGVLAEEPQSWLSLVAVARRHEVHVCDVYRAVMDGKLPARLPSGVDGRMTVLDADADHWAASRPAIGRSDLVRTMLIAVPVSAAAAVRQHASMASTG